MLEELVLKFAVFIYQQTRKSEAVSPVLSKDVGDLDALRRILRLYYLKAEKYNNQICIGTVAQNKFVKPIW